MKKTMERHEKNFVTRGRKTLSALEYLPASVGKNFNLWCKFNKSWCKLYNLWAEII